MANRISWVAVGNLVAQDAAWFYAFPSKPKADEFVRLAELHTKDVDFQGIGFVGSSHGEGVEVMAAKSEAAAIKTVTNFRICKLPGIRIRS